MKYCGECGNRLDENAKFCHECGTKIQIAESSYKKQTENVSQSTYENQYNVIEEDEVKQKRKKNRKNIEKDFVAPKKKNKRKRKKRKIIPVVITVFILCIIGLMFLGSEDNAVKVFDNLEDAAIIREEQFIVPISDEEVVSKADNGVEIMVPSLLLDEETTLSVKEINGISQKAYDTFTEGTDGLFTMSIELGDIHEFYDFLEIKVPLSHEKLSGTEPEDICVMSIQPETGEIDYELVEVKGDNLVFYTDHLSNFQFIRDNTVSGRIKKATMINVSKESMDAFINKIKSQEIDERDAVQLGYEASSNGISWAGNFQTYVDAISNSKGIEKISKNLSLLGNSVFYINCAKTIYEGMEYGDYGKVGDFILNDGLGYAIARWGATPIQLSYTTAVVMKYVGDEMNAAITEKADEKFNYAAQKVHEDYIKAKYPVRDKKYKYSYYKFKREMKKKFSKVIANASSEENAFYIIDKTLENIAIEQLSDTYREEFFLYAAEYLNQNNYGASEDDGDFITGLKALFSNGSGKNANGTLRTNNQIIKQFIEKRKKQLYIDLRYEFEDIASYMLTKAEKGYYSNFKKIQKDTNKMYEIDFVIDGPIPKEIKSIDVAFLLNNGEISKEYHFDVVEENTIKFKMSFADYIYLEVPKKVRLSIKAKNFSDELEQPFQFRLENQTIKFPIIDVNKPFDINIKVKGDYPNGLKNVYAAYIKGEDIVKKVDLGSSKSARDTMTYNEYKKLNKPNQIALFVVKEIKDGDMIKTKTDIFGNDFEFIPDTQDISFEVKYSNDDTDDNQDDKIPDADDTENSDNSNVKNMDFDSVLKRTFYELDRVIGENDATDNDYEEYKSMYIQILTSDMGISDYDNVNYIDDFYRALTEELGDSDYYGIVKHLLPDHNDDTYDGTSPDDNTVVDTEISKEEIERRTAIVNEYIKQLDEAFKKDTKYMLEGNEYGEGIIKLIDKDVKRLEESIENHKLILNQLKSKNADEIKNYSGGYARHGKEYYYEDLEDYSIIVNEYDPGVRAFYQKYETGYNNKNPEHLKDYEKLKSVANEASANTAILGAFEMNLGQVHTYNANEKYLPIIKEMLNRSIKGIVTKKEIDDFYEEYRYNTPWSTSTGGVIDSTNIYGDHLRGYLESIAK